MPEISRRHLLVGAAGAAALAAVDAGRRISVRSGGHCYENVVYHPDAQAIIDLSEFREIGFDASAVAQRDSVMKLLVQSFWSSPAEDAAHQGG